MDKLKFRHENKYVINWSDMVILRSRLRASMSYDSHANENGLYTITSLYFDNYNDKALTEKIDGVSKREKFRIRYYNFNPSSLRLEKKSKVNGLCCKQSANITQEECIEILNGCCMDILSGDTDLKKEFYAKMRYQILRPRNIVVYEREAFVYPGNVRITFDCHIRGSNQVSQFLNPDMSFIQLFPHIVMEIKWGEIFPRHLRDIVQIARGTSVKSFSKYVATRFI